MLRLLISTGEVSGDLQGSLLIEALKEEALRRDLSIEILALGGNRMEAAGAELIADTAPMGAIGLLEALPLVLPTLLIQSKVNQLLISRPPDAVVLIDYMGANIRLGNRLRKHFAKIPIIYYIAPQEWAWRIGDGGTTDLIAFTDKILAIFQAEADFYQERGGNVVWVGHPMIDIHGKLPDCSFARRELGLSPEQKLLLLLPASRKQELRYLMPNLAKAAAMLQAEDSNLEVIVPAGQESFEFQLRETLKREKVRGRVIPANQANNLKPILLSAADLALSKSGTVNMELALHGVPQVVGYKVSRTTAFIARNILKFKVEHISPVNLLLEERLVPELVQDDFTAEKIFQLAMPLLSQKEARLSMLEGYRRLRGKLGSPGVTSRAAGQILDFISQ
ncbi:lipid-A-disaccharide synthase [Prochlorococcus sp. MIT 1300]|uniref:lipid-A-disaccharide synthase n=1 Tax=Prochlorococcus sp. MIT 1300 TaxID=3096218 RepID=UPI002A765CBE|nr:lipid-A-disaccharide synthase [Prochlorococcus sp. MIT 1300]